MDGPCAADEDPQFENQSERRQSPPPFVQRGGPLRDRTGTVPAHSKGKGPIKGRDLGKCCTDPDLQDLGTLRTTSPLDSALNGARIDADYWLGEP